MGSLGPMEILLIFLVILLVFGAKRIPEIARGLGKGIREFKDATSELKRELTVDDTSNRIQSPRPPAQQTAPRTEAQSAPQAAPKPQEDPASAEQPREQQAS